MANEKLNKKTLEELILEAMLEKNSVGKIQE